MNITWVTWSYHVSCRRNSDVDRKKKKKKKEELDMTVSSRWHVSCRLMLWLQVIPWWRNTRWHILEDLSYCIMLMHTWVAWLYNMLNWLTQAILPQIDLWILKMDRGSSAYVQLRVLCSNRNRTRQLQNIYACTGRPMYLWCWNEQACRSHICIVDAPHQREASGCHVCLGKAGPSYINTGPWPPYPCLWGRIIRLNICGANWLPWLLKKADPLNLNIGPWDTHPSKYGACLWRMDMCKWSIPITILNHSQMVASVAKKKQALYIQIQAPGARILQHMGYVYQCGCLDYQNLPPY